MQRRAAKFPAVTQLPIDEVLPDVVRHLRASPALVLVAPPGAGKTTRLPQALVDQRVVPANQRVLVLEPRRLAARLAAKRIAEERGVRLGQEVGYQVRFDDRTSKASRIVLLTEGILTRRLQSDPFLEGVGAVVLDEFHERSIHADLGLALLREVQQTVRDDLKLVVMSATLDPLPVQRFLGDCPVVESKGRAYPIDVHYLDRPDERRSADVVVSLVRKAVHRHRTGDVLAFLPGAAEIRRANDALSEGLGDVDVRPLYGDLSPQAQDQAVQPGPRRKVVLATNIAESSLTIPSVSIVVDGGEQKISRHDSGLGLDRLELTKISRRSAEQRAGRAGRTGPGHAYRAWTEAGHKLLAPEDPPEILRVDLAPVLLDILTWSASDPTTFGWYTAPSEGQIRHALALLRQLGAVSSTGYRLTDLGKRLAQLPLHPRLSALLVAGADRGRLDDAALVAAIISERDVFRRSDRPADDVASSDILVRADALRAFAREQSSYVADAYGLQRGAAKQVLQVRDRLVQLGRTAGPQDKQDGSEETLLRLILAGFPDRVGRRLGEDRYAIVGGSTARLARQSVVRDAEFLVAVGVDAGRRGAGGGVIRLASQIEQEWLSEDTEGMQEVAGARWNRSRQAAEAVRELRYFDLVLRRRAAGQADPAALSECLEEAARLDLDRALPLSDALMSFFSRVRFLAEAMPELELRNWGPDDRAELLPQLCIGRRSFEELRSVDLPKAFERRLPPAAASALARHAPTAIKVPSGSTKRLRYDIEGPPTLSVRLQEVFGLYESPRLADGRVPVKMELLAPNQRPVQVTQDLASFWATTYTEVRKELRQRYPKHQWPEDPAEGVASARTLRKRRKT